VLQARACVCPSRAGSPRLMALCFPAVPRRRSLIAKENLNGLVNEKTCLQLKEHDMHTVSNTHYTHTLPHNF